ncbi:hypothetical protein BT69DRAFT_1012523 [Atractiella rhizophila]|nr:hypothetical protein BT69DRAFT_1012523 [Atractiella rhizophila]
MDDEDVYTLILSQSKSVSKKEESGAISNQTHTDVAPPSLVEPPSLHAFLIASASSILCLPTSTRTASNVLLLALPILSTTAVGVPISITSSTSVLRSGGRMGTGSISLRMTTLLFLSIASSGSSCSPKSLLKLPVFFFFGVESGVRSRSLVCRARDRAE